MLYFDHCYTRDPGHRFHKWLETLGFELMEAEVEHPGRHFCRFIAFEGDTPRGRQYLEFINVKKNGEPVHKPGLSFGFRGKLDAFHARLRRKGQLKSRFVHKNYEWKKDARSRLPGWNFVTFKGLGFRSLFPWITEYEPSSKRKKMPKPKHKNGVRRVLRLEIEINHAGEDFFEHLFGRRLSNKMRLTDGTEICFRKGRRTTLRKVVLKASDLTYFKSRLPSSHFIEYDGRPAVKIANPQGMWDLIVTR